MAASRKFDISASPDKPPFTSGLRMMYGGTSLDRSSSFRESMENPILSRSSLRATQGDIQKFFQSLHFDPKVLGPENKFQQLVELKKAINVILATSQDNSAPGSLRGRLLSSSSHEDLKKTKAALQESSNEARERFKLFSEALFAFKKFFPSIPLRKGSRTEGFSSDRTNFLPLNARSGGGARVINIGTPGHSLTNAPEPEIQKSEERIKNTKRPRTSLPDVRANSLARHFAPVDRDRDRDVVRSEKGGALLPNEQRLPIDSWERSKMKKKRSGTKAGISELKQGMRQRLAKETLGFRSGVVNGALGIRKLDGELQHTDSGVRSSISRLDHENGSVFSHHKERSSDKEGVILKTVNKTGMREGNSSHSPISNIKGIAPARASRSNTGTLPNMSPNSQQLVSGDWKISQCINKPSASGPTNRKRKPSAQSSSPPVAHWAGQRPQKISRTARRTNFLPIVADNDETLAFDAASDAGNDNGYMFVKPFPSISPQEVKLKCEKMSESEESGATDPKKEKKKKNKMMVSKADGRTGHNVKKASNLVFPTKKSKLIGVEKLSDGVQRQGGISKNLASRSLMPTAVKKLGNVGKSKQPRPSKMDLDKAERKTGCPPMRKLSDRKAYTRNRLYAVNATPDFGDDGQQELLAAAKAIVDPSHLTLFWRHMELVFRFISEADIGFLKQLVGEVMSVSDTPNADAYSAASCLNGLPFVENLADTCLTHTSEQWISEATSQNAVPLCQRLIAALIPDEQDYGNGAIEEMRLDSYEPGFQLNSALEYGALTHGSVGNFYPSAGKAPNGCRPTVTGDSLYGLEEPDKPDHESHMVSTQNFGGISSSGYMFDGLLPGSEMIPITETAECQYVNMPIEERLILELQGIGIFPEQPETREIDNEEVSQEIRHLGKEYNQKVAKKRHFILKLSKFASETKELQEHNFEQCALEKLVTMAYGKYMASLGGRSAASKMTKQAALAFVNRTLEHYQRYEETGISCFRDPLFKNIFSDALNKLNDTKLVDRITERESDRDYPDTPLEEPSLSEQNISKQEKCSDKMRKEQLLDGGDGAIVTSGSLLGTGRLRVSSTKGKRSDRDRNGKGRAGTAKLGRPAGNNNGDRKSKAKAKQRTTQLKGSVSPLPCENMTNNNAKEKKDLGIDDMDDPIVDMSSLEVPGIDVDLGAQGQDLASWLNIDDDLLQDHDFMGLEIPMDDLFDVNMMDLALALKVVIQIAGSFVFIMFRFDSTGWTGPCFQLLAGWRDLVSWPGETKSLCVDICNAQLSDRCRFHCLQHFDQLHFTNRYSSHGREEIRDQDQTPAPQQPGKGDLDHRKSAGLEFYLHY